MGECLGSSFDPPEPVLNHQSMASASLQQLLAEEGFERKKSFKSKKKVKLRDGTTSDESVTLPVYICHSQKSVDAWKQKKDKASTRKGSSGFSSKRLSSDSERSHSKSVLKGNSDDEPAAMDDVAIKAVVSILSGYIGRYKNDMSFREMIRDKCNACLVRRKNDSDNGVFANMELGMEGIEKLFEDQGKTKELRIKSLRNSIQLLSIVASLNSKKSRNGSTCGVPNSHLSACAQLYLSIVYKLEKNDRISARHLLQVFCDSPFLARTHLLPDLWEHFFLPHLLHLKVWYQKELEFISSSQSADNEKRMKDLSKIYDEQMDTGTTQFALYYKRWLKVGAAAPPLPSVPLPSSPSYALSRRRLSDSCTSQSSINRNLCQAVFGSKFERRSLDLDFQIRASLDAWDVEEENECSNDGFPTNNASSVRRKSGQNFVIPENELWPETQKGVHFRFLSCQSILAECMLNGNHMVSNTSIRNEENAQLPSTELSRAISTICSSDSLADCENAVRVITKAWLDSHSDPVIDGALSKERVIEGVLEVMFSSEDDEILELAISVLAELVAKNEANRLMILNSDPQLEIFMRLLKSSSLFLKAAVLLYLLKPKAKQMISIEWVALVLRVLEFGDQLQTLFTVRCIPQQAGIYFLEQLLTGFSEDRNLENASQVVSLGGLNLLVRSFETGDIDERNNVARLMCCCIQANGCSRNYLADNLSQASLLELIVLSIQKKPKRYAFTFLTELLCLSRRAQIIKFLTRLNEGWNGLNAMHIFLVYLQSASPEERPMVAAVLLQLDLLGDPFKHSIHREEAVETIIEALDSQTCSSKVQEELARALLMLGGCFSYTGEATTEEWLLQQAGFHGRSVDSFCTEETVDWNLKNEEEEAVENWQRKVAVVLLNSGGKRFLAALSNSIANGIPKLAQSSLFTVAWMNRILSVNDESSSSVTQTTRPQELPESSSYYNDRTTYKKAIPSPLLHPVKNSECLSMLTTLDKELINPLRNPSPHTG